MGILTGLAAALLATACSCPCGAQISASPDGHYVAHKGRVLMLIGDSGTQCVTQNTNLDYRAWIDDCAARGIPMVHVWSFMAPRQKQDGSLLEKRWGYVYPGVTPWARRGGGPPAADQLPCWDLRRFDDGGDDDLDRYWPRMRDLCRYARGKGLVVGITVFTGWAKYPENWDFHPLNRQNGGHLGKVSEAVLIDSPGSEVWRENWSDDWSGPRKTQWVWERFSHELLEQLNPFGNVFFVFLDEHSYDEGNMGDHFRDFFKKRGALWMDWENRRDGVDFVYSDTLHHADTNRQAMEGFMGRPARPHFLLEGEPYQGPEVRTSIWTFSMGGGHFTFHADEGMEIPQRGIMGYDPHVAGGDRNMGIRDWLGHAARFFNRELRNLDRMAPHNELTDGNTCCLACPGVEYAVYSKRDAPAGFRINLAGAAGTLFTARFYDPATGTFSESFDVAGGGETEFTKPGTEDWVLHLLADSR